MRRIINLITERPMEFRRVHKPLNTNFENQNIGVNLLPKLIKYQLQLKTGILWDGLFLQNKHTLRIISKFKKEKTITGNK